MGVLLDYFRNKKINDAISEEPDLSPELVNTDDPEATLVSAHRSSVALHYGSTKSDLNVRIKENRKMASCPKVSGPLDEIINGAIVDESGTIVEIETEKLDDINIKQNIKDKISEEFENIIALLNFNQKAKHYFRKWYVDGRLYFNDVIDPKNIKRGIKKIIELNPLDMERLKDTDGKIIYKFHTHTDDLLAFEMSGEVVNEIEVDEYSITFVPSGETDPENKYYISPLQKATRPWNHLLVAEAHAVIYRIARAPEKRVFYIGTGNLGRISADKHVKDIIKSLSSEVKYDPGSGKMVQTSETMTMLEDFFLPVPMGDNKSTRVETLPGGAQLGEINDIVYLKNEFLEAMRVPFSRFPNNVTNESGIGAYASSSSEISREEMRFSKYIDSLRRTFSELFYDLLKKQLILKKIILPSEWDKYRSRISFQWKSDSYYEEIKNSEILQLRAATLTEIEPFLGKFYSEKWARQVICKQTDDAIEDMDKEIEEERLAKEKAGISPEDEDDI